MADKKITTQRLECIEELGNYGPLVLKEGFWMKAKMPDGFCGKVCFAVESNSHGPIVVRPTEHGARCYEGLYVAGVEGDMIVVDKVEEQKDCSKKTALYNQVKPRLNILANR